MAKKAQIKQFRDELLSTGIASNNIQSYNLEAPENTEKPSPENRNLTRPIHGVILIRMKSFCKITKSFAFITCQQVSVIFS
jgi:hypothetical protein